MRALSRTEAGPWATATLTVPAPPPTPVPTPRPTPIPTPTPLSNAYGMGCVGHESYPSSDHYTLITEVVSDIKLAAMFANPPAPARQPWEAPKLPKFQYGFMLRSIPDVHKGLLVLVNSDSEWSVKLREGSTGGAFSRSYEARDGNEYRQGLWVAQYNQSWGGQGVTLSSGGLRDAGIPFNTGAKERNHVMFIAEGNSYTMAVNGHNVPLNIDSADLAAVEAVIGRYRHYDDGKWHGHYNRTYKAGGSNHPRAWTGGNYETREQTTEPRWVTVIRPLPWSACKP